MNALEIIATITVQTRYQGNDLATQGHTGPKARLLSTGAVQIYREVYVPQNPAAESHIALLSPLPGGAWRCAHIHETYVCELLPGIVLDVEPAHAGTAWALEE